MATLPLPTCETDVADAIADAARAGEKLTIRGGGSKAMMGAAVAAQALDLGGLSGVVDYDPAELVLTLRPGTPLSEVQALVAGERQMLAFDPFDHAPLFGQAPGQATIGGVVAAGVAGSQRVSAGSARDHLLGFRAVSGRGEVFVAGAKVVKNVTGYDLPKLAAGSWGRLFGLTELTLKVLPRPEVRTTLTIEGLSPRDAVAAMARAMGSQADVAAAAHLPAANDGSAVTALRLQGFGPSVAARATILTALLADHGPVVPLDEEAADALWDDLRTIRPLATHATLWRINVPPSHGWRVVEKLDAAWLFDWAGGLVWIGDGDPAAIRAAAEAAGGHATLVRAPEAVRNSVPMFHPAAAGLAALEARVRRAFDPAGVFETGRF
ncbi:glycolate oxidase subunit GlcE [Sphingomonas sp. SUN019]|uniref:glycolate oxidase subunit GlcE n=1 Tax=Sphingomonas sp. SUN019 TaxID=2937788 RepID=UPI0021642EF7|nr:glycolate oxidase subunit GlcE [Sphingomonas sp. SUN019]UVO50594.1 glycolate oxidase subunit GlcE [Sphingomonas sp. SUN019]